MTLIGLVFWVLYILSWAGGWYFSSGAPATPGRPYNFGWAMPLVCIGILGWFVLRPH
jgi:hypothetical protein